MKKVLIIGSGLSGLTCSYAIKRQIDCDVKIIGSGNIGGDFVYESLGYIEETKSTIALFDGLGLYYSDYSVYGGILLRGSINPYPICFKNVDKEEVKRIKGDYFKKSRLIEPGKFITKAFNDPESNRPKRAIRVNYDDLVHRLANFATIIKDKVVKVTDFFAFTESGNRYEYDYLVYTIPLWEIKNCSIGLDIPSSMAVKKNLITIGIRDDDYEHWDFVLCPYTPDNNVYKIVCSGEGDLIVETSGEIIKDKLFSDLNFLFRKGWCIKKMELGLKGCMLPLEKFKIEWPENIATVGRFAVWDNRITLGTIFENANALVKKWF